MKRLLRDAISTLEYRLRRGDAPGTIRMLMYHRVTDAHPRDRLCVPIARFDAQMRFLRDHGYRAVTFDEATQWVLRGGSSSERLVAVTFDDGYEDNFLYAYPSLTRYGLTGTFFVPSAFIEDGAGDHPSADRPMSWAQLQELIDLGHTVGAHSVSHRKLTTLDQVELFWEIRGCKETLEYYLDHEIDFFCYPAGDYNAFVKRVVQASGYRGACTVAPGALRPGMDPFEMTRTDVSGFDSLWDFEKKLAGAYDWMHAAVQAAHRLSPKAKRQPSNAVIRHPDRQEAI